MSEVIDFLRNETEKLEYFMEELLALESVSDGEVEPAELRKVIVRVYRIYGCVEKLREIHPEWVFISENRLFDLMRALIDLDVLPPVPSVSDIYKSIPETIAIGFLYVFHVFQMHAHSLGRFLENNGDIHESAYRAFTFIQNDLALRSKFLDLVRAKKSLADAELMAEGVNLAFYEMEKHLDENAATN